MASPNEKVAGCRSLESRRSCLKLELCRAEETCRPKRTLYADLCRSRGGATRACGRVLEHAPWGLRTLLVYRPRRRAAANSSASRPPTSGLYAQATLPGPVSGLSLDGKPKALSADGLPRVEPWCAASSADPYHRAELWRLRNGLSLVGLDLCCPFRVTPDVIVPS